MFVQSLLTGLVELSSGVGGSETRAFSIQVVPPSSLRMIPTVVLLSALSSCDPTSAYTRAAARLVDGATARSMRPIPEAPAASMTAASPSEARIDVQVTPLSSDRQISPRFPSAVFGAGH